jgi:hypothetical protein
MIPAIKLTTKKKVIVIAKILTWIAFVVCLVIRQYSYAIILGLFTLWDVAMIVRDLMRMKNEKNK